jgi:hypothetical protein
MIYHSTVLTTSLAGLLLLMGHTVYSLSCLSFMLGHSNYLVCGLSHIGKNIITTAGLGQLIQLLRHLGSYSW